VMQSADLRNCDNSAVVGRFDLSRDGRVAVQREMRSRVEIVVEVRS
jgi:hypothetical protein